MEYKRIETLPTRFSDCPSYWINFLRGIEPEEEVVVQTWAINKALKKYKAKYKETKTQGSYIRFDDERLERWFKLTWA